MAEKHGVVICGAGIAGVSAACFLARAGVEDIVLIDERPPLTVTSDRSTECYRDWWPDVELMALMARSISIMEQLALDSSNSFRMNHRGYLYVTADSARVKVWMAQAARIEAAGGGRLRVHSDGQSLYQPGSPDSSSEQRTGADILLGTELVRRHYPFLSRTSIAALHVRRAGWLSAQQLGMHLLDEARKAGVRFRFGRVEEVRTTKDHVRGVTLATAERIDCKVFVNAAGPFFKDLGMRMGLDLPVETELHMKVAFDDPRQVVDRLAPLLIWDDPQIVPWQEDEKDALELDESEPWLLQQLPSGAHTRPEGDAESRKVLMLWDYRPRKMRPEFPVPLDPTYADIVLRGLSTMLPALSEYFGRAARPTVDGGYYVKTAENRLLVGPTKLHGAYLIGALSGYGIMSACAAGELLAAHVTGSTLPTYAPAFALDRYQDPQYRLQLQQWGDTGEL